MLTFRHLLPLIAAGALLAGCGGIDFGSPDQGNDFFEKLEISGEHAAGAPLTAELSYETFYPMEVEISCELYRGSRRLFEIGRATVPAVGEGRDPGEEDERVPGNFSFDFSAMSAGSYEVECFTPCDESNYILEEFSVRAARTPLPEPETSPTTVQSAEPTRRPCNLPETPPTG